jgi:glycosyltransferase involved in cell wall biosynthesis
LYILQSHPIQYFSPLFKKLSSEIDAEIKVLYCHNTVSKGYSDKEFGVKIKWDTPLLEGFSYGFLRNYSPVGGTDNKFVNQINFGIVREILKNKPDVLLIHGWAYFTIWLAVFASLFTKTKIWLKCETPLNQELLKSKLIRFAKSFLLRNLFFKFIHKFLYIGDQNKQFYEYHKIKPNKLFFSPYSVDNDFFHSEFIKLKAQKTEIKNELKISEKDIVILFSGKLINKKRPFDLLEAFYKMNLPNSKLIFLGDGELKSELSRKVSDYQLDEKVIFTGFVNQSEISKYYLVADVFVLPSSIGETWGLVVNEAMNFGLPVIVSDVPGSAYDLVQEGQNGFVFPVGNVDYLSEKLLEICSSQRMRNDFGKASIEIIKKYSYSTIIDEINKNLI